MNIGWLALDRLLDNIYVIITVVGSMVVIIWMVAWIRRKGRTTD